MGFYFPPEIIVDILSRLPNESLRQCKLVCKTWRNLMVYDPSFTRMHIQHRRRHNDHDSSGELSYIFVIRDDIGFKKFYYATYNSKYDNLMKVADMDITHTFGSNLYSSILLTSSSTTSYRIVGSCDGLICIALYVHVSEYKKCVYRMYICNPMTRECLVLPHLDNGQFGFGYVPSTNEYNVIAFIYAKEETNSYHEAHGYTENCCYQTFIYTLGSGSGWRNVGLINSSFYRSHHSNSTRNSCCNVFLNGALIWVDKYGSVMSFDLADEKLHLLPLPPCFEEFLDDWGPEESYRSYELLVLGDCLCIVLQHHDVLYDFWLLKKKKNEGELNANCGIKEQKYQSWNWTREFTLRRNNRADLWDIAKPFALTMDGKILFHNDQTFYLHDFEDETSYFLLDIDNEYDIQQKWISYDEYNKCCLIQEAIPHVNSFVSMKALGEKDTVMIKSNQELNSIVPDIKYTRERKWENLPDVGTLFENNANI